MMRQAALGEVKHEEKKDQRRRVHEVSSCYLKYFWFTMEIRHQDLQVRSQADWLRIDAEEEDIIREATGGVLATIPRGSVTMDISMRDPSHTQSPLSLLHTPP